MNIGNLFRVFALPEDEQRSYFPKLADPVIVKVGQYEVTTEFARMISLCNLAHAAKRGEVNAGALGEICLEVASLSTMMIEVSGIWPWLVWHPDDVANDQSFVIDPLIYGIWSVMRRLSRDGLNLVRGETVPFWELFGQTICKA